MAKQIGLKNTTLTDIELLEIGETVPVSVGSPELILDLSNMASVDFRKISTLQGLINSGDVIIFDGIKDLDAEEGYEYLIDDVTGDSDGFWYTKRRRFTVKFFEQAHGFVPGVVVYVDAAGNAQKATAGTYATSNSSSVIAEIIDIDNYYAGGFGSTVTPDASSIIEGLPLSIGSSYYLSASQAGKLTLTPPSAAGEIIKMMAVAIDATTLMIFNYPGYKNDTALNSSEIIELQSGNTSVKHSTGWVPAVLDTINDPSTLTPSTGDRYIVGAGVGVWLGRDNEVTEYNANTSTWYFTDCEPGHFTYDVAATQLLKFDGVAWVNAGQVATISLQDDGTAVTNTPHDTLNFVDMNVTDNGDGSADIQNVFGSYFQKTESLGISTTVSTTAITKLSMVTPVLPIGTYRISVSYGWNHDSTTSDFEAWLDEDTVQKGEIHKQEPKDSTGTFGSTGTSQKYYTSRVYYSTYASATAHTFNLDFRTDLHGKESSMWDTVIEIWRVS